MPVRTPATTRGKSKRKRVDPKIIRAWFDTAVNPLLSGLESERTALEAKNWTWRFQPPRLLSMAPVREQVRIAANLEQFFSFYPGCERLAKKHDTEVRTLFESCQSLHQVAARSKRLKEIYKTAVPRLVLPQGKSSEDLFGAHPVHEWMDVLAEHIVNGTDRLPSYYAPAQLWNENRGAFLSLRNDEEVRDRWQAVENAGQALFETANELIKELTSIRNHLSLEYGEPLAVGAVQL